MFFHVYIIIRMPAPLVLSVNNRYSSLRRTNIRYGKNGVKKKINGRWVLFKQGKR